MATLEHGLFMASLLGIHIRSGQFRKYAKHRDIHSKGWGRGSIHFIKTTTRSRILNCVTLADQHTN